MSNKELYLRIIKVAMIILLISIGAAFILFQNLNYPISILFGGILSTLGFIFIAYQGETMALDEKVQTRVIVSYIIRYILYFICMAIGAYFGLNILCMLVGFLCINLGIKFITMKGGK